MKFSIKQWPVDLKGKVTKKMTTKITKGLKKTVSPHSHAKNKATPSKSPTVVSTTDEEEKVLGNLSNSLDSHDYEANIVDGETDDETTKTFNYLEYFKQYDKNHSAPSDKEPVSLPEASKDSLFSILDHLHSSDTSDRSGNSTFHGILKHIDNLEEFSVLRSQLETLKHGNAPLDEPESYLKRQKADRVANYKSVKKNVTKKWIPIIKSITESETLRLGESKEPVESNLDYLVSSFKSTEGFEKEIDEALQNCGITNKDIDGSKEFAPAEPIKSSLERQQAQRLKAIMFREHRRNKRLSNIKSKLWHKIHNRSENREKEKLMTRLEVENPELATQVRREYEAKYASLRMMRRQNARKQWIKEALRFGGKDVQKVVAKEKQSEYDERKAIQRIVKSVPHGMESSQESEEEEEAEENGDELENSKVEAKSNIADLTHRAKLQAMRELKKSYDPLPEKGLFAMGFMKRAIEKQRESLRMSAQELVDEIDSLQIYGTESKPSDTYFSDSENDAKLVHSTKTLPQKEALPKFSKSQIEEATIEIEQKLSQAPTQVHATEVELLKVNTVDMDNIETIQERDWAHRGFSEMKGKAEIAASKQRSKKQSISNKNPWIVASKSRNEMQRTKQTKKQKEVLNHTSDAHIATPAAPKHYDEMLAEMTTPGVSPEQQALIAKSFVTSTAIEDEFNDEMEKNENELDKAEFIEAKQMDGWGSWTGNGIVKRKSKPTKVKKVAKATKKVPVIINKKLDRKAAKYYIQDLPYPFNTKEEYEANLQHPIGREWNVAGVHHRFIQPKINVRIGAIVPPVEYAKALPPREADTLLNMWTISKPRVHRYKAKL